MRIVVNGQQAFGKAVLEALLERGENIVAVYCPEDQPGKRADPVKELALARGLPVFQPTSFKGQAVVNELAALEPDLGVMAFVTKIVPPSFLEVPKHGTIQYHPSLLPRHRGPSSINWPIIQGETRTGLTIFWPDDGLDTGPVLLQKTVEIGPDDTLGTVYFEKLFPLGVSAMVEAVDLVKAGKAPRNQQDHSQATYEVHGARGTMSASTGAGRSPRSTTSSAAPILIPVHGRCSTERRYRSSTRRRPGRSRSRRAPWPQSARMESRLRLPAGRSSSNAYGSETAKKHWPLILRVHAASRPGPASLSEPADPATPPFSHCVHWR